MMVVMFVAVAAAMSTVAVLSIPLPLLIPHSLAILASRVRPFFPPLLDLP